MQITRFESLSRSLARDYEASPPEVQFEAALTAVEFAMKQSAMTDSTVLAALEKLRSKIPLTATDVHSLEGIRRGFDDENERRLQEASMSGTDPVGNRHVDAPFLSARATAALLYASAGKGDESIYEAAATADDENEQQVIDLVATRIKQLRA